MKYWMFIVFVCLVGCTSIDFRKLAEETHSTNSDLVEFVIEHKPNFINLSCGPINEEAGKSTTWVEQCNKVAFDYLTTQQNTGVDFQSPINKKPFGMAADAIVEILRAKPANIDAISLSQTFIININKA